MASLHWLLILPRIRKSRSTVPSEINLDTVESQLCSPTVPTTKYTRNQPSIKQFNSDCGGINVSRSSWWYCHRRLGGAGGGGAPNVATHCSNPGRVGYRSRQLELTRSVPGENIPVGKAALRGVGGCEKPAPSEVDGI